MFHISNCAAECTVKILTFSLWVFAVSSQQMCIVCRWYGFCWMVSRDFNSPPDLTPFTLDKHNTEEKRRFYVGGWVITCRKRGLSNSPGRLSTHKSSSNESFLSKQGGLKQTEHGAPQPPTPHPSLSSPFFLGGIFMRKEEMKGCKTTLEQRGKYDNINPLQWPQTGKKSNIILSAFTQVPLTAAERQQIPPL